MDKLTLFKELEKNNIVLTESQFRRYIQYGYIVTEKTSKGRGKGVKSKFPVNTIEIIFEIERLKRENYNKKDRLTMLFLEGFLVDFEKLKNTLIDYVEDMIKDFTFLIKVTDNKYDREFIIETFAEENMPKLKAGRPSRLSKQISNKKKQHEQEKIQTVLKFVSELMNDSKLSSKTSFSLMQQLGYTPTVREPQFIPDWINTTEWISKIRWGSEEELFEVQLLLKLIKMYYKFLKTSKIESEIIKSYIKPLIEMYKKTGLQNPLFDPNLVRLIIILLLVNTDWRKKLNNLLSFNESVQDFNTLKQILPPILQMIDITLMKGENKDE